MQVRQMQQNHTAFGLRQRRTGGKRPAMTSGRVLPLQKVHNFRDYGDYPIVGGGRLRGGLLYRSAQHAGATGEDLAAIGSLGLATVIDFRGDEERRRFPCPRPENFAADVLFHDGETGQLPPHLQAELAGLDAAGMRAAMAELYREFPFRRSLVGVMRIYLDALANRDGASLVHCLAGKDRTGMAVAVFHRLVGLHPDDVMEDYLLTNSVGDQEARIAAGAPSIRERYGEMSDGAMRVIMSVAPEYLENAFAAIDERFGSIDRFAEEQLGVDPARRDALKARYVAA